MFSFFYNEERFEVLKVYLDHSQSSAHTNSDGVIILSDVDVKSSASLLTPATMKMTHSASQLGNGLRNEIKFLFEGHREPRNLHTELLPLVKSEGFAGNHLGKRRQKVAEHCAAAGKNTGGDTFCAQNFKQGVEHKQANLHLLKKKRVCSSSCFVSHRVQTV